MLLLNQGKAIIVFQDLISAVFAQKSLNGHFINDINVRLLVDWANPSDIQSVRGYLTIPSMDENTYQGPPGYQNIKQSLNISMGTQYMGGALPQQQQQQQQQQLQQQQQTQISHQYSLPQPQNALQLGNNAPMTHDKDEVSFLYRTL